MKTTKPSPPPALPMCRNALVPGAEYESPNGPDIPFAYAMVSVGEESPVAQKVALIRDLDREEIARWQSQVTGPLAVCFCPTRLSAHAMEVVGDAPHESWRQVPVDVVFDLSSVGQWGLGVGLSYTEWLSMCVHVVNRNPSQRNHIKDPYLYFDVSRALNLPMSKVQVTKLWTVVDRMLKTLNEQSKTVNLEFNDLLKNLDKQLEERTATN